MSQEENDSWLPHSTLYHVILFIILRWRHIHFMTRQSCSSMAVNVLKQEGSLVSVCVLYSVAGEEPDQEINSEPRETVV